MKMFKHLGKFLLIGVILCTGNAFAVLPNIFATQPSGNVAASKLDTNFTFIESQGVQGLTTSGSSNAYVATPADAWVTGYSSYVGRSLTVVPNFTNSSATTINVSGLGAASIYKNVGGVATATVSGDMVSNLPAILICDGTGFLLANPTGGAVTSVATGTGLTGGPITGTGTIALKSSTANSLAGYDGSGVFSSVSVGSGLSLSGSSLTASGGAGRVTTVPVVTDSTDIVLSNLPTQANIGSTFSCTIPTKGRIEFVFLGRLVNGSVNEALTLGLRIGSTNYWPSPFASSYMDNYRAVVGNNQVNTGYGFGYDNSNNFAASMPTWLFIEASGIPTGAQTCQLIGGMSANGGTLTIKGTVLQTKVYITMYDHS